MTDDIPDILAELNAHDSTPGSRCIRVRLAEDSPGLLEQFDKAIHAKFETAMGSRYRYSQISIVRAFRKHQVPIADEAIAKHRAGECLRCQTIPLPTS
jgi:hypothetical protein